MRSRVDPEDMLVIVVLGAVSVVSIFKAIPEANTQLIAAITSGLVGYLAKSVREAVRPDPPPPANRPFPPSDLDIPPAPPAS